MLNDPSISNFVLSAKIALARRPWLILIGLFLVLVFWSTYVIRVTEVPTRPATHNATHPAPHLQGYPPRTTATLRNTPYNYLSYTACTPQPITRQLTPPLPTSRDLRHPPPP